MLVWIAPKPQRLTQERGTRVRYVAGRHMDFN